MRRRYYYYQYQPALVRRCCLPIWLDRLLHEWLIRVVARTEDPHHLCALVCNQTNTARPRFVDRSQISVRGPILGTCNLQRGGASHRRMGSHESCLQRKRALSAGYEGMPCATKYLRTRPRNRHNPQISSGLCSEFWPEILK